MRAVLRREDNASYWDRRWRETGSDPDSFTSLDVYPIRYAEMVMGDPVQRTLELGAGLGRVLKHYRARGHRIVGLERSAVAVERLRAEDADVEVVQGEATALPFPDRAFDVVLAFGVFHNVEIGLDEALAEVARCLRPGGRFCISMRPDNFEMLANEWYWRWRNRHVRGPRSFHKWLVGEREFARMLVRHGLRPRRPMRARNVSLLYRLPFLCARGTDEHARRAGGYGLNGLGRTLDRGLVRLAPTQFCNVLVYVGTREERTSW